MVVGLWGGKDMKPNPARQIEGTAGVSRAVGDNLFLSAREYTRGTC